MTKVLVVGDIHAEWGALNQLIQQKQPDIVLQCGDFGWWPGMEPKHMTIYDRSRAWYLKGIKPQGAKVYWCDGNHEDHLSLETHQEAGEIVEMYDGVYYCPRGSVLTLPDGRRVMFYGGAHSIDKDMRTPGFDWFPEELPTQGQFLRANNQKDIDIIISHTMPLEVDVSVDQWRGQKANDPTRYDLSCFYQHHEPSQWFFGHWHVDYEKQVGPTKFYGLAHPHSGRRWWRWLE